MRISIIAFSYLANRYNRIIKTSLEADVDLNIGRKINEDVLDLINSNSK